MKYPPRRPGGWLRAPVNNFVFTDLLMELLVSCGMRLVFLAQLSLVKVIFYVNSAEW
jgi:hypothetical protein